nr:PPOX class F420-dependent oxidoreductase [Anaerolineae bacterium]
MDRIPEQFHDLISDAKRAFLYLATLMPDGTPQVTPVWFNHDGQHILINSARGRVKDQNMRNRPQVACLIVDPDNAYRYLQLRGEVTEIIEEDADEHINDLKVKYTGSRGFAIGDDIRVTYKIRVDYITAMG